MNEQIYNETIENTVIGLILNNELPIIKALGELSPNCFTQHTAKAIWDVLSHANKVLTVSEIEAECVKRGKTIKASDIAKLKILAIGADVKMMVSSLFEFYRKREVFKLLQNEYSSVLDHTTDSREVANRLIIASSKIMEIVEMETKKSPEIYDTIAEIKNKMDGLIAPVMPTYIENLDNTLCGGFEKGTLNIVAARQGCGKTALTTWILQKNAQAGKKVGFISMEMTRKQLNRRELSMLTGIYYGKMKEANRLTEAEYRRIAMAGFEWEKSHFIREYCGVVDIDRLRLIINKMVYQDGCEYIVIDYLQRMQIRAGHGQNTAFAIAQICAEIKAMATQHDVGIVLLSQLNRSNEKEAVRIPKITDLRDSGGIEEVADTVTLLHRPDIYEDDPIDANGESLKNKMLIISAKNRDGEPNLGYFILCNMGTNQYFNESERSQWTQSFHINPNKFEEYEPKHIQPNANVPF
jgi:replicative DNA helicase